MRYKYTLKLLCRSSVFMLSAFAGCRPSSDSCPLEPATSATFAKKGIYYDTYYTYDQIKTMYPLIHGKGNSKMLTPSASSYYSDSQIQFPLDVSKDTTTFIFEGPGGNDTLVLQYKRAISKCESDEKLRMDINNLRVARHTFDSLTMNKYYYNAITIYP